LGFLPQANLKGEFLRTLNLEGSFKGVFNGYMGVKGFGHFQEGLLFKERLGKGG